MLNKIIRFSVRNKLIIGLFILALIGWGIYNFTRLPIDAVPDITNNQVQVITVSPSLAAPEVERLVTFPIEQATTSIPGITEIRSFSRFGLSLVTIVFKDDVNVYWARQQVSERLAQVRSNIPPDAGNPELGPVTTGIGEIYQYVVRPKKGFESQYTEMELRTIQDWIVRRQLLGTPGVADVSSFGGKLKQYEVAVNTSKLKSLGVTIKDVFDALQQNNQNTGGAYIEKGPNVLYIRSEGLANNINDINHIAVTHTTAGIPVYIRDLAEVRIGSAIRYGAMCFNDQGEVAGAVVMMLKGENSSKVIHDVKKRIEQISKTLPEGVVIEPFLDRTKMVDNAISTVKKNLIEGALIVIFILVIFLGNLRAGLIVASVIPLSMLFAVSMMNLFGVSGNLMSLGALDFGLIVDGAVIIVEAVMHRLYHSKHFSHVTRISQQMMNEEVEHSSGRMMNAAVFGQIIILIVYLPILSLAGIEGKMFRPMAQTVSFALIGAFILSLTYVPMISSLVLNKNIKHVDTWADKMMRTLEKIYRPVLKGAMQFPKTVVISTLILFGVALVVVTRLGGEFIPKLEEGDFAVDTRTLTGSSLTHTIEATQQTAAILIKKFPEVEKVVTKIGSGEIPTDPMPVDASDMMVILKDKSEWTSAKTFDELANKMSKALEDVPGVTAGFQFPVQMRFNELITGARQDVVCKIFGEDLDSLANYARRVGDIVRTVPGARDLYVETVTGLPQIVIHYNREAIARYKVSIDDVNRVIRTGFAGESAGMIYENERRFDLVVRLNDQSRKDISDVQNLLVPAPGGIQVPLYQLATVEVKEGPNQIQREDAKRRIMVGFNVRNRDVQSVVAELNQKVGAQMKFSPGYYVTYGGQFENLVEAKKRLSIAVPVALLLILFMLYFAFGRLKYGLLIFSAIPLSAIGGVFALWLRDMPFSISAGVGFIALFGVAVLNGIVLITEFNRLRKQETENLETIIMQGTATRLRPVLMTASVASFGFLPMALSYGAGAEVQRPLATVVIGGLITATLLTLIVLPVLYKWMEGRERKSKKNISGIATSIILLFFCMPAAHAQSVKGRAITLDSMLQMASRQNLSLQATRKNAQYWQQLKSATTELPKTQLGAEYGNINSINNDTRFYISQSFSLPVVYKREKQLYEAQELAVNALAGMQQQELNKAVKQVFNNMADLLERSKVLQRLDSIYARFLKAAELRFKTGETNTLEKTTAEAQMQQLKVQQQQLAADIGIWQMRLKAFLNTDELLLPDYNNFKRTGNLPGDTTISNHPEVQYRQQQQAVAAAETAIQKARLTPDFTLGYSNQSIIGYQSKDGVNQQYYGGGHRFNIYQLTMGIPIFNKPVKARIKAGQVSETVAALQTDATAQQLKSKMQELLQAFDKYNSQVHYYETTGLQQSETIIEHARQSFQHGDISYLEWTVLMNNAVTIQSGYLESVKQLNETIIELEYLTGK